MPVMNIIQSLNHTLHEAFATDKRLLTFGEDVGAFGGVFRVTSGLQKAFGNDRHQLHQPPEHIHVLYASLPHHE